MKKKIEKFIKKLFISILRLFVVPKNIDPSEIDLQKIKKIIVILRHQMGDMLVALPMLYSLREHFKTQHIALLTKSSSNYHLLFTGSRSPVNDVIKYEYGLEKLLNTIRNIEYEGYDLAIVPSTTAFSSTNHLAAYLAKVKLRAGTRSYDGENNPYEIFLNVKKDFEWSSKRIHQIERNLDIIRQLGIHPSCKQIEIDVPDEQLNFAETFYNENFPDKNRFVIGFHPGAGKPENVWDPENFASLADMLHKDYEPYFFISQGPKDEQWVSKLTGFLKDRKFTVHNGVLLKNIALISKLDVLISNDTGIMHIASGLKIPVIGLFGPTKAYEWGPLGNNKFAVRSKSGSMDGIKPETVYNLCREIIVNSGKINAVTGN
jgi:ADP-heptose:LPS heptosyltransferase